VDALVRALAQPEITNKLLTDASQMRGLPQRTKEQEVKGILR
jgi:hypothetical protein